MHLEISGNKNELGAAAAESAANSLKKTLAARGEANLILATGASQFEMLGHLTQDAEIDWSNVTIFHLDEYIGMPDKHPASFRKYLKERFEQKVPSVKIFHYVLGDAPDPDKECRRLGSIISKHPIDVACIGIGENAHIAFNDPPADFETEDAYIVVDLDETCRKQQFGEGWFETLEDVPTRAISMSVNQIMKSKCLIVSVPDNRKANAIRNTLEEAVAPQVPASILREHPDCRMFLDQFSASDLSATTLEQFIAKD